jgi:PAS domain S-box-containing protein
MPQENQITTININGIDIDWNHQKGTLKFLGISSTLFWNDPSLLNMFKPLVEEVGKDIFCLQVAYSSSLGTDEDYNIMVTQLADNFKDGFLAWGKAVGGAGWGTFEVPYLDISKQEATVVVHNPWELEMQKSLEVEKRWGCPFMQGKVIGIFHQAFNHTCWADETIQVSGNSSSVSFKIYLNKDTIHDKLKSLREKKEKEKIATLKRKVQEGLEENNKLLQEEKKLRISLEDAQSIASVGSWKLDVTTKSIVCSGEVFKIFEIPNKNNNSISYKQLLNLLHPDEKKQLIKKYQKAIESQKTSEFTHKIFLKNKKVKNLFIKIKNNYDEATQNLLTSGIMQDITERVNAQNELEDSQARWKYAIEGNGDGLWDWSLEDNSVFFSTNWKSMLGFKEDEIEGSLEEWDKRVHPDDKEQVYADITRHLEGNTPDYKNEHRVLTKDGTYIWILDRGKIIEFKEDASPKRMIGTHTDITESKRIQEELIKTKELAEEANKVKSEFLANMSHEIRTPLNGTIGLTEIVLNTELQPLQREYLEKSKASSQALLRIINDTLDYSKIEAGKLDIEMERFTFSSIIENIHNIFDHQTQEKKLKFLVENEEQYSSMNLLGDSLRVTQILVNLLGNAIKFTQEGYVKLAYKAFLENHKKIKFEFIIEDTGIGMNKNVIESLFNKFTQADTSTTRKFGGTGLGLAICKHLVELMGGTIRLESEEGKGSKFIFSITFSIDDSKDIPSHSDDYITKMGKIQNKKILLVEDNKVNQLVVIGILEDFDIAIDIANNGQEAIDKHEVNAYDLVLMDLQMPVMNGFEATKAIRKTDDAIPIISLSAAVMKEDIQKSNEAGVNYHLAKPINSKQLFEILVEFLGEST